MAAFDETAIVEALAARTAGVRADLQRLVRIPSVSAEGFDPAEVVRSAEATAEILEAAGLGAVRLLEIEGAHPAVLGHLPAPPGAPTVLLYAHHDVQPTGPRPLWRTDPFEPVESGGRLYGRGAADDKAGIAAHVAAVTAWEGRPPVGVTVFVEGEEETGSDHLGAFLARYGDALRADAVVLADSSNWAIGEPALTTSLRGLVECVVEVRTLDHAVHSGFYGGAIPDALSALARLLATLHDDRGRPAVEGLAVGEVDDLDFDEAELRRTAGMRPGVALIGTGKLHERLWAQPAVSVLGVDAPAIAEATNQLVPVARAKVSVRVAPGQDPDEAMAALVSHLEGHAPFGAEVTVTPGKRGPGFRVRAEGRAFDAWEAACRSAWGRSPKHTGVGGSIPFVAAFAAAYSDAALLLTGVEDPETNAHAENESLHLGDFASYCRTEALFLGLLAG